MRPGAFVAALLLAMGLVFTVEYHLWSLTTFIGVAIAVVVTDDYLSAIRGK